MSSPGIRETATRGACGFLAAAGLAGVAGTYRFTTADTLPVVFDV
jgi:hypothetical protein